MWDRRGWLGLDPLAESPCVYVGDTGPSLEEGSRPCGARPCGARPPAGLSRATRRSQRLEPCRAEQPSRKQFTRVLGPSVQRLPPCLCLAQRKVLLLWWACGTGGVYNRGCPTQGVPAHIAPVQGLHVYIHREKWLPRPCTRGRARRRLRLRRDDGCTCTASCHTVLAPLGDLIISRHTLRHPKLAVHIQAGAPCIADCFAVVRTGSWLPP